LPTTSPTDIDLVGWIVKCLIGIVAFLGGYGIKDVNKRLRDLEKTNAELTTRIAVVEARIGIPQTKA